MFGRIKSIIQNTVEQNPLSIYIRIIVCSVFGFGLFVQVEELARVEAWGSSICLVFEYKNCFSLVLVTVDEERDEEEWKEEVRDLMFAEFLASHV